MESLVEKTAVLILGHGSPVSSANDTLKTVASMVKERGGFVRVIPAYLQFGKPDFLEAIEQVAGDGIGRVIIQPYFLYRGAHVSKDLPSQIEDAKRRHPFLELILAPHLGLHHKLVDVAIERIKEAMNQGSRVRGQGLAEIQNLFSQHPIEQESFRIIGEHIDESRFSSFELPIVKRVIHATADFEFADILKFSPNSIEAGIKAIKEGRNIVTDVKMVEVGIGKKYLDLFGINTYCFVSAEEIENEAEAKRKTRSAMGIIKGAEHIDNGIVVIGNSPTALFELISMVRQRQIKPALIIGVPVGFVEAEEAKEELLKVEVPYITCKGKKGGSTVAVAITNALLILAKGPGDSI